MSTATAKHTPGPFGVFPDEETGGRSKIIVGNMNAAPHNRHIVAWIGYVDEDQLTPEDEANATLIAAAPDLLEHLKCAVWYWSQVARHAGATELDELEAARAAIAKAEGSADA